MDSWILSCITVVDFWQHYSTRYRFSSCSKRCWGWQLPLRWWVIIDPASLLYASRDIVTHYFINIYKTPCPWLFADEMCKTMPIWWMRKLRLPKVTGSLSRRLWAWSPCSPCLHVKTGETERTVTLEESPTPCQAPVSPAITYVT